MKPNYFYLHLKPLTRKLCCYLDQNTLSLILMTHETALTLLHKLKYITHAMMLVI